MTDRKIKGLMNELSCQCYLTSLGYNVSVPLGEDCKYDMIADIDGMLIRIQVKSCTVHNNGIQLSLASTSLSSTGAIKRSYSKNDIDFFATYYNNKMYIIPIEECGNTTKTLSFEDSKYSNNVCIIDDYLAELQIEKLKNGELFHEQKSTNKILQYDLKGNFIGTFNTFCDAAKSIGKSKESATHIAQVCNGKRKTAYNYIWKLSSD